MAAIQRGLCRRLGRRRNRLDGQLGVLDQTRLDVVSARNDSEQAGIGWCLVIGILDQIRISRPTRFRPTGTVSLRRSSGALVGA
jgi:hypothetical protein